MDPADLARANLCRARREEMVRVDAAADEDLPDRAAGRQEVAPAEEDPRALGRAEVAAECLVDAVGSTVRRSIACDLVFTTGLILRHGMQSYTPSPETKCQAEPLR